MTTPTTKPTSRPSMKMKPIGVLCVQKPCSSAVSSSSVSTRTSSGSARCKSRRTCEAARPVFELDQAELHRVHRAAIGRVIGDVFGAHQQVAVGRKIRAEPEQADDPHPPPADLALHADGRRSAIAPRRAPRRKSAWSGRPSGRCPVRAGHPGPRRIPACGPLERPGAGGPARMPPRGSATRARPPRRGSSR